jgi:hypothetical protein
MIAKVTTANRSIERLRGILEGISIDGKINTYEITGLYNWVQQHEYLHNIYPFKETIDLLTGILKDGVVTDCEKEEILDWCLEFCDGGRINCMYTNAVRRLHGLLHGIIIDNKITDNEIYDLHDWLLDYENFHQHWPFCEVFGIVSKIIEDEKITEDERKELYDFCCDFSEKVHLDQIIHDEIYTRGFIKSDAPVLEPISLLCEKPEYINFEKKSFCFTGLAKTGPRWMLENMLRDLNGFPADRVTQTLDFLVIGDKSSPAWVYSTYGRKVEAVIENQKNGYKTTIISEETFLKQAKARNR